MKDVVARRVHKRLIDALNYDITTDGVYATVISLNCSPRLDEPNRWSVAVNDPSFEMLELMCVVAGEAGQTIYLSDDGPVANIDSP